MPKYLLVTFSDCKDPKREKEYNDWYDNIHMPDMLEVPGFISGSRWVSADNKENEIRKYLSVYWLETDDLKDFNEKMRKRGMWTMKAGRWTDLGIYDPDNVPRIYRQITEEKRPKGTVKNTAAKKTTVKKAVSKKTAVKKTTAKKK